jgi:hypothetical protein
MGASILQPATNAVTPGDSDTARAMARLYQRLAEQQSQIDTLSRQLAINVPATQEDWHAASYAGGWGDPGVSGYPGAAYFKEPSGLVNVRGLVGNGTLAANVYQTVLNLPAGYRPAFKTPFLTVVSQASNTNGAGIIVVFPDGQVQLGTAFTGAVTYAGLDVVRFKAAG